jgi:sialidase-1
MSGYVLHKSAEILEKQLEMARAFNLPIIWGTSATLEGQSLSVARDANVPALYSQYCDRSATPEMCKMTNQFNTSENLLSSLRLLVLCSVCFILTSKSRDANADEKLWLDPACKPLPFKYQGPFIHLDDGILAIHSNATIVSEDGGQTWSEPRPLFEKSLNIKVSNERALLRTRGGVIIAAYMNLNERNWTWNNKLHDAPDAKLPTYVMRSLDNGKTWQDIQKMHDNWSGAVRDMIQMKDGRVIFTAMKMMHDPGRHTVLTYSSSDDGATWKASNLIDLGGRGHHGGVTEPTITELKDGRAWMLIRTNWNEFWSAYSNNGGRHWQVLQPSGIPAGSAPGLVKRLASGRLVLVWNRPYPDKKDSWPLSGGDGLWSDTAVSNHREELSIAFSEDEGNSWSKPVVIARQKGKWLAYPYVFENEPGQLWITTMQGGIRLNLREQDFVISE